MFKACFAAAFPEAAGIRSRSGGGRAKLLPSNYMMLSISASSHQSVRWHLVYLH